MERNLAIKIMGDNKQLYDLVAEEFSQTRTSAWPEFNILTKYFKTNDKVLDLGCGNGRFIKLFEKQNIEIEYFGADNSEKLLAIAKKIHPNQKFFLTDGLILPFAENYFDKVLAVAVLHHVPSLELQQQWLDNAYRILKPKGLLILSTWSLWPNSQYLKHFIKYSLLKIINKSKMDWGDIYLPWGKRGWRYFHHFTKKQLTQLLSRSGFKINSLAYLRRSSGQNNLLAVAEK